MASALKTISVRLPVEYLTRIGKRNRSEFIRSAVADSLWKRKASEWKPQTPSGKRRAALRAAYVKGGGELLDAAELAAELRQRRGGRA